MPFLPTPPRCHWHTWCPVLNSKALNSSTRTLSLRRRPQVAWKGHLHMLHPSPAMYAAFMGDVAMWTGLVTGSLMLCSPVLFDRFG